MNNITVTAEGKDVVIRIVGAADPKAKGAPSKSGKSQVLASTRGNMPIDHAVPGGRLGLNLYRPTA